MTAPGSFTSRFERAAGRPAEGSFSSPQTYKAHLGTMPQHVNVPAPSVPTLSLFMTFLLAFDSVLFLQLFRPLVLNFSFPVTVGAGGWQDGGFWWDGETIHTWLNAWPSMVHQSATDSNTLRYSKEGSHWWRRLNQFKHRKEDNRLCVAI